MLGNFLGINEHEIDNIQERHIFITFSNKNIIKGHEKEKLFAVPFVLSECEEVTFFS